MNWRVWLGLVGVWLGTAVGAQELPPPKTGGAGGQPMAMLIVTDGVEPDAKYQEELVAAGYRVEFASFDNTLSAEYLKQFAVVVLTRLPFFGQEYTTVGWRLAPLAGNLALLDEYVRNGGGLLFEPAVSEFGEAYVEVYNRFLAPYDARYLAQQLRHAGLTKGTYAVGGVVGNHPIAAGVGDVLYPITVLRWDHAYSTTPPVLGPAWTVVAAGKPGAATHIALDNSRVTEKPLTQERTLFAVRSVGKGLLALSAVHSYYTLTNISSKEPALGENATGVIDWIAMKGEPNGRPSGLGKLLDQAYRFLAANSVKNGLGAGTVVLPPQPPAPTTTPVIDWHVQQPPPTWQHRVIPVKVGDKQYYDELADPAWAGELKYFKVLIGPRTALSSGSGTVRAWREAALKAGYNAIVFCETLEDLDAGRWRYFVEECDNNSDATFLCLPGLELSDFQGQRYLVLCARRFPDPEWLTPDRKQLAAVRMLSLGWSGHVACVHRPGRTPLNPKMYKHFQAITVFTYDGEGREIDNGLNAYQWSVRSDSNPVPIAAHELTSPAQVAKAATSGFQQIAPGPTLAKALEYFRFPLPHYFECPQRYFISEGPILDGWSIFNKDLGDPAENRDHFRLGIGVKGEPQVTEVTLYDGFDVIRRWRPRQPEFRTYVDGFHGQQREFTLLARDGQGRRVLSPGIRTVTRNWRLRCGDRQNWLGTPYIYTGTPPRVFGGFSVPMRNTREGGTNWLGDGGENPAAILDFPFFANHVQVTTLDHGYKYIDAAWEEIAYDAKPTFAVRTTDYTDGQTSITYFAPPRPGFAVALIETEIRLRRDIEPDIRSPVYPFLDGCTAQNKVVILPDQAPTVAGPTIDLPVGSYAGGLVTLTPGLRLHQRSFGFPAPAGEPPSLPEGTTWRAAYLVLKSSNFQWRQMTTGFEIDDKAEVALKQMGFRGPTPYQFDLKQGKLERLAYIADCAAATGGISGTCRNDAGQKLLFEVPLRIHGLNPNVPAALWRADAKYLQHFGVWRDAGYVTLDADKTVEFFAGNIVGCDPRLAVDVVVWNEQEAWFRLNNPTLNEIVTDFVTAPAIRGFKALKEQVTVPPGGSIEVKK